ncbi:MAG: response regulator, partial [Deltaproteobacteria bacterium]|nr:response regulator [Deltaproteobacteria bacterium]
MNQHVLIVDDEKPIRSLLARMLAPLGAHLSQAENGRDALDQCQATPFDLVLSDLKMPVMDGISLLKALRSARHDAAFVILTAFGDLSTALELSRDYNVSNFLVKPIHNVDQFLFQIQSALNRRKLEADNRQLLEALWRSNEELEAKVHTRTKELTEKNLELDRLSSFRKDVLKVVGHELRTPLALLKGHLSLQKTGILPQKDSYQVMDSTLDRMQNLVDKSLLQVNTQDTAPFRLHLHTMKADTLCESAASQINSLLSITRNVTLACHIPEPVGECVWDKRRIESVLDELLVNGARATPDGGRIDLFLEKCEGGVEIRVKDTGCGLPPEDLSRI